MNDDRQAKVRELIAATEEFVKAEGVVLAAGNARNNAQARVEKLKKEMLEWGGRNAHELIFVIGNKVVIVTHGSGVVVRDAEVM